MSYECLYRAIELRTGLTIKDIQATSLHTLRAYFDERRGHDQIISEQDHRNGLRSRKNIEQILASALIA